MSLDLGLAVQVHSIAEEYAYITAHPCSCGGRWRVTAQAVLKDTQGRYYDRLDVICRKCGKHRSFSFHLRSLQ
jgi:hypothetical protein